MGPGGLFPSNPDLADILGRTDLNFENLYFENFLDPKFLDFQVPRSPNSQISRSPDLLQIPRSQNSQISRFPDFQTPPPDKFSDPNLIPLPTHPGIEYVPRALAAACNAAKEDNSQVPKLVFEGSMFVNSWNLLGGPPPPLSTAGT